MCSSSALGAPASLASHIPLSTYSERRLIEKSAWQFAETFDAYIYIYMYVACMLCIYMLCILVGIHIYIYIFIY